MPVPNYCSDSQESDDSNVLSLPTSDLNAAFEKQSAQIISQIEKLLNIHIETLRTEMQPRYFPMTFQPSDASESPTAQLTTRRAQSFQPNQSDTKVKIYVANVEEEVPVQSRTSTGTVFDHDVDLSYLEVAKKASSRRASVRMQKSEHAARNPLNFLLLLNIKMGIMISSWWFEAFFAFSIVTNSILIGAEIEYSAQHITDPDSPFWLELLQQLYSFLFLTELLCRLIAEGRDFFWKSENYLWNYLDLFLVTASMFEVGFWYSSSGNNSGGLISTNFRIIRIAKVSRLVRVLRVVKVVKFIRALRALVFSIMHTLKTVMWALILLLLIIYIFSILFTDAITGYAQDKPDSPNINLLLFRFGGLHASMHTLFRCITGGVNWEEVATPLRDVGLEWVYLLSAFVAFCLFAVLNVMTGVFCQSALEGAQRDHDLLVQSMLQEEQKNQAVIRMILEQLDLDNDGSITLADFEHHFEREAVKAFFHSLDLDASDAWTLFKLLDQEGSGEIDIQEFINGCIRLKGGARNIDVFCLIQESKAMKAKISNMNDCVEDIEQRLTKLQQALQTSCLLLSEVSRTKRSGQP